MVKSVIKERRNAIRAKRVLSIEYRLIKSKLKKFDGEWHLSTTENMSTNGIGFYTEYEYRVGDILEMNVIMSGILDIFKGLGEVVRVEKKKTGSYFFIALNLTEASGKSRNAKSYQETTRTTKNRKQKRI